MGEGPRAPRRGAEHPLAALRVPIDLDGHAVGVIECGPKRTGRLDDDDRAIVVALAAQAALAVHNARLKAQVDDRNAALTVSRSRLVRAQESERPGLGVVVISQYLDAEYPSISCAMAPTGSATSSKNALETPTTSSTPSTPSQAVDP